MACRPVGSTRVAGSRGVPGCEGASADGQGRGGVCGRVDGEGLDLAECAQAFSQCLEFGNGASPHHHGRGAVHNQREVQPAGWRWLQHGQPDAFLRDPRCRGVFIKSERRRAFHAPLKRTQGAHDLKLPTERRHRGASGRYPCSFRADGRQ